MDWASSLTLILNLTPLHFESLGNLAKIHIFIFWSKILDMNNTHKINIVLISKQSKIYVKNLARHSTLNNYSVNTTVFFFLEYHQMFTS